MNPYLAYRRQEVSNGWTRIDLLLALFDKALERLAAAEAALAAGDESAATTQLIKTQLILTALASGVQPEADPQNGANVLRLYEFAAHELSRPRAEGIANARTVLRTLREGFEGIRAEANELERTGRLPSAEHLQMIHATA